jgi:hypothetical protein
MKKLLWFLAVLSALLVAALPLVGQQRAPARCVPVRQPIFRAMADSMMPPEPYIRTNGSPSTRIRDNVAARLDSVSCTPVKVDTVRIKVPVIVVDTLWKTDTLYLPAGDSVIPLPPEDSVPEVPPTGEQFADTLRGVRTGDVVVSGRVLIANLEIRNGSLHCSSGTVAMRPGSSLKFTGGNPSAYVGGGMQWTPEIGRTDFGMWIDGTCALDLRGTPKTPWNRTGQASDWSSTDDLRVAPVAIGDYTPKRYTLGAPVPRADSLLPPAEVVNVSRDVVISGTGHVHVQCSVAQRVEYVRLDSLGIAGTLGRYALHFHMCGEGSRESVVRGVAAFNSRGRSFVPHASHGIRMVDNVCVDVAAECLWWDPATETNDLFADRMGALGFAGDAFVLDAGTGNELRNSFAAGGYGNTSRGFVWPEPTPNYDAVLSRLVWTFDQGNVAHNVRDAALSFWNNEQAVQEVSHVVANYVSYRNGLGITNGAYTNCNQYRKVLSFEDGVGPWITGIPHPAVLWNNNSGECGGERTARFEGATLRGKDGPALVIGHRQVPAGSYAVWENVTFIPAPGQPKVLVQSADESSNPWKAEFRGTNVQPADIVFQSLTGGNEGSHVIIDPDGDGPLKGWDVRVVGGKKVVSNR